MKKLVQWVCGVVLVGSMVQAIAQGMAWCPSGTTEKCFRATDGSKVCTCVKDWQ